MKRGPRLSADVQKRTERGKIKQTNSKKNGPDDTRNLKTEKRKGVGKLLMETKHIINQNLGVSSRRAKKGNLNEKGGENQKSKSGGKRLLSNRSYLTGKKAYQS